MGTTTNLALPWPAASALVKAGAAAIQALAEAVESELRGPLLVTDGDGTLTWSSKVAEVPWDVSDDPARKRGGWDAAGTGEQLVIPTRPGYYLVCASVKFAGKAEADTYGVQVRTRQVGDAVGSGTVWTTQRIEVADSSGDYTQLGTTTIVRVATTTPKTGITVRMDYTGSTVPPAAGTGANKLRIHWLSSL